MIGRNALALIGLLLGTVAVCMSVGCQAQRPSREIAPPLPALGPDEELWIIQRPSFELHPSLDRRAVDALSHGGAMVAQIPGQSTETLIPMELTAIHATIENAAATVQVSRRFRSPFSETIGARYIFMLPHDAAIDDFLITVGPRRIRGILRQRREAEQLYNEARRQGYTASLLQHDHPGIFTQSIANIPPRSLIDVDIRYVQQLAHHETGYEFSVPMGLTAATAQDVPPRIALTASIEGAAIDAVQSNHAIALRACEQQPHRVKIRLHAFGDDSDDFTLRYATLDGRAHPASTRALPALNHGVMSADAAFIAVDALSRPEEAAAVDDGSIVISPADKRISR